MINEFSAHLLGNGIIVPNGGQNQKHLIEAWFSFILCVCVGGGGGVGGVNEN